MPVGVPAQDELPPISVVVVAVAVEAPTAAIAIELAVAPAPAGVASLYRLAWKLDP